MLKLGGELLEDDRRLKAIGRAIKRARAKQAALVVVHGGGREIDAALAQVGIPKRQVDGLRVTDARHADIVVSVLAGSINTRFVAAINAAGGKAVGLTGADAGVAPVEEGRAAQGDQRRDASTSGMVGDADQAAAPELIEALCRRGYMPVIACIGASKNGQLFNVNADTLAGSLAARLKAQATGDRRRAPPACSTSRGQTIPWLDTERHREAGEVGHGERRHGRQAARVPGGAEGRRRRAS